MWGIRGGLRTVVASAAGAAVMLVASTAGGANGLVPNDPYYPQQWGQRVLDMPEVWKYTTGDPNVIIAMVDTGVSYGLADVRGQFVAGWDLVDNDPVSEDISPGRHGTYVSTALAALGNNGADTTGYCWGCKIMPVRVTRGDDANRSMIAAGIRYAVEHGARIITVGFSGDIENFEERAAVRYAREKGALVISSAGNTSSSEPRFPAFYPDVLSVAATDDADRLYFWSTRGSWVKLAAPGCAMVIDPAIGPGTQCGTSLTLPSVAGIAGLLLSLKPSMSDDELYDLIVRTARPVAGIGGGRIDPVAAIRALGIPDPAPAVPPATTTGVGGTDGGTDANGSQAVERTLSFRSGVMKKRISRFVRVGAGRLEVHFAAARVRECQIFVVSPRNEFTLSLLRPIDQRLRSFTEFVRAGRHRVDVECEPGRKRSFQLSISGQAPKKKK